MSAGSDERGASEGEKVEERHDGERKPGAERGLADRCAPWRSGNGVVCG